MLLVLCDLLIDMRWVWRSHKIFDGLIVLMFVNCRLCSKSVKPYFYRQSSEQLRFASGVRYSAHSLVAHMPCQCREPPYYLSAVSE